MASDQYLRLARLLGEEAVETLHTKHIVLVGMGAVGGMCLESLTRSGVGSIRIVDFDTVGLTNLNRQILATHQTLGKLKTEVASERIKSINPECNVEALPIFAGAETMDRIFDGPIDLVIDAIDSLNPKWNLLESAYKKGIPVISSMGAALRRNPFLVRKADLMDTYGCPLARAVRSNLRKRGVGRGIDVIFSPELVNFAYKRPEEEEHSDRNEQILDRGRKRNVLGSLPTVTAIFGQNLAHLALTKLLGETLFEGEEAFNPN